VTSSDRDAAQQLTVQQSASKEMIKVGDLLDGVVTSLQPYSAFVKLGEGIQALLHISQITGKRLTSPAEVLAVRAIQLSMCCMQSFCRPRSIQLCLPNSCVTVSQLCMHATARQHGLQLDGGRRGDSPALFAGVQAPENFAQ
jgi:hypothetical protein